jgi:putative flippase GtrA
MTSPEPKTGPFKKLAAEIAKFGVIGAIGYVIDVGGFNLLVHAGSVSPLAHSPLTAKIISSLFAITFSYFGNRHWTWRDRPRTSLRREYFMFLLLNGIALVIAVGCLAFSRYVLHLDSSFADNLFGNVIGIGLGTLFRFWSYRKFVFAHETK